MNRHKITMKKAAILLIYILASTIGALASDLTAEADSAYNKEDYRLAIRLYLQAIDDEGISPEIYYNLGNAYYRIDELGKSVLYYQRALNLDPSMKDARANLEFVKTKIADKPEDDSSFLGNVHEGIISAFTPNAWAWIAFVLFASLIGSLATYIFTNNVTLRKVGFFGGFVILVIVIYVSVVAFQSANAFRNSGKAVVTVPTANLRTMPGASLQDNEKVIPIHEGTILEITDSMTMPGETASPKWYDVKINNSTRAWVNASDVERI